MKIKQVLPLLACLALAACVSPEPPTPALPVIDPAAGEAVVERDLTLYNAAMGLAVTLPSGTRLAELENLGLLATDYPTADTLSSTSYGEDGLVYSLADMTLDRGGFNNYCRVILAAEHIEGVESAEDFGVIVSRRFPLTAAGKDYALYFEGSGAATLGGQAYGMLTFSETMPGEDRYLYEVYFRALPAGEAQPKLFFTAVLFYNADEPSGAGRDVGRSYLETGVAALHEVLP